MITAVPAASPVTIPEASTPAMLVLLLLQLPPAVASVSDVVLFTQTFVVPLIGETAGNVFTVIVKVFSKAIQPPVLVTATVTWSPFAREEVV